MTRQLISTNRQLLLRHHMRSVRRTAGFVQVALPDRSPITPFYKGESQEKNLPGDWKERKSSLRFPAHVVLRVSGDFFFFQIHLVIVTALSGSEARQAAWLKCVNHGSI
jgi:hypothetical protein